MSTEAALTRVATALEHLSQGIESMIRVYGEIPSKLAEIEVQVARVAKDIEAHDRRIEDTEKANEEAEALYVKNLEKDLKQYADAQTHWTRYLIAAIVSFLASVLLFFILKK